MIDAAELAELRAGEDDTPRQPGTRLTPGQWIYRWNQLTAEQRLTKVAGLFEMLDIGQACFLQGHDGLRAALDAANRRISELLDGTRAGQLAEQVLAVRQLAKSWADGAEPELDVDAAIENPHVFAEWLAGQHGRMVLAELGVPVQVRSDAEAKAATDTGDDRS